MDFFRLNGKRYRRSTETGKKKLAQQIENKVKAEVVQGKWFERLPGEEKKFDEMMKKYLGEHASKKASLRDFAGNAKTGSGPLIY